jgi:hypothetical protein
VGVGLGVGVLVDVPVGTGIVSVAVGGRTVVAEVQPTSKVSESTNKVNCLMAICKVLTINFILIRRVILPSD